MSSSAPPVVLVVVVTYNSEEHVEACLAALLAQRDVATRVVVVDNASADATVRRVRDRFPAVEVVALDENVGFARANNLVLARGEEDWIALVNPDTEAPPDALATCLRGLAERPRAGAVGLRQRGTDGADQATALPFPGLVSEALGAFGLHRLGDPAAGRVADRPARVDWLQGSFLVARGAAVQAAGLLDPDYFMYGEDVEWCRRLAQAGYEAWYLPAPVVLHHGGASAGTARPALFVESWKGRLRYYRRHRGRAATIVAGGLVAGGILGRTALREVQALVHTATGRPLPPRLAERRALFRRAAAWVAAGMPLAASLPPARPAAQRGRADTSA